MVNPSIRRHLDAAVAARPILSGDEELCTHAFPTVAFRNEPTLHETNWMPRIAAICMRAEPGFEEPCQDGVRGLSNENGRRQSAVWLPGKDTGQFPRMLLRRSFGPKRLPEP